MRRSLGVAVLVLFILGALPSAAQEPSFREYNPDIDKYAFTSQFIVGLGYYKKVFDRLKEEDLARTQADSQTALLQQYVNDRTLDNIEIRIARNYLTRFTASANGLIGKVARDTIARYDDMLALNMKERGMWQELFRYKTTGKPGGFDETGFSGRMDPLVRERKEMSKGILTSAALIKKVLLSAARCETEECQYLALTTDERRRLGAGLDQFARDNFQWGMKEGQSTFDASVAVIREVLEDPVFFSKEK